MKDELFIRGNVPMTKSEVRTISLAKLELTEKAVLWDIGAGTGSVSIEAALAHPDMQVIAIERNPEAVELIRTNAERFGCQNIQIVEAFAPYLPVELNLPIPTHAFLGGTGFQTEEILTDLFARNQAIRIVANAVTLETIAALQKYTEDHPVDAELITVQIAKAEKLGRYHMMKAQNPVTIVTMSLEEKEA